MPQKQGQLQAARGHVYYAPVSPETRESDVTINSIRAPSKKGALCHWYQLAQLRHISLDVIPTTILVSCVILSTILVILCLALA